MSCVTQTNKSKGQFLFSMFDAIKAYLNNQHLEKRGFSKAQIISDFCIDMEYEPQYRNTFAALTVHYVQPNGFPVSMMSGEDEDEETELFKPREAPCLMQGQNIDFMSIGREITRVTKNGNEYTLYHQPSSHKEILQTTSIIPTGKLQSDLETLMEHLEKQH